MVIITAEMSLFCINSLGYISEGRKKKKTKTLNASTQMCGKRGTERRKAKRRNSSWNTFLYLGAKPSP